MSAFSAPMNTESSPSTCRQGAERGMSTPISAFCFLLSAFPASPLSPSLRTQILAFCFQFSAFPTPLMRTNLEKRFWGVTSDGRGFFVSQPATAAG